MLERTLILAPHPDDEAIATGGLMQRVLAGGGEVKVVFVTDGENNPWPVRYEKRKWRINDAHRAEWATRRREESRRSLSILGAANAAVFLGYPDRALTRMVRAGDMRARETLRGLIADFAPTLVVSPSTFDLHSDHRAIAWLVHGASAGSTILTYVIHGHAPLARLTLKLDLTDEEAARKRAAIECHQTQLLLSRKRFLSYARSVERFYIPEFDIVRIDTRLHDWTCALRHSMRVITQRGCADR